jgi:5-methylcytosine-specific restriction endonuclease McrA
MTRELEFLAWVRLRSCLVCGRPPVNQAAHVKTRGSGGKDLDNVVPLCYRCHSEQHTIGIKTFQKRHGLDLERDAQEVTTEWKNELTPTT